MAEFKFGQTYRRFIPHLLMTLTQVFVPVLLFLTKASLNHGMNVYIFVTYRLTTAAFFVFPFAYFLERRVRPKLTLALFAEIFAISLFGVTPTMIFYFAGFKHCSPTISALLFNTIAPLTLIIAVTLRLEALKFRSSRGMAKVIGTVFSLAGVVIMTLYKGPGTRTSWGALINIEGKKSIVHENQILGSILVLASCISSAIWYIMQAITLKKYPAQLSLTTWMMFISGAQSAILAVIIEHKLKSWAIGHGIDLWAVIYSGVVCSGLTIFIQLFCTEKKGPVFVSMFNPLGTVFTAVLAYFVLGEKMYMGSCIGGVIVIVGLYLVLWGQEEDIKPKISAEEIEIGAKELEIGPQDPSSLRHEEPKEAKIQVVTLE